MADVARGTVLPVRHQPPLPRERMILAEAPDAERLMRSRYSAFALREVAYLWKTLHPDHPDRHHQ